MKSDLSAMLWISRGCELANRLDDFGKLIVMGTDTQIQFGKLLGKCLLSEHHSTKRCEGADYKEAHPDCAGAIEHRGGHERSMLGKGERLIAPAAAALV
jgi:hypothetical protein